MDIERIDLNAYRKSGEGANGSSYDLISDERIMVKMYNPTYPVEEIYQEYDVAEKVYSLGIPSPQPGELVTDGERLGIRFKRILGKRSYSRMLADEPERYDEFAREFAEYCRKLHSVQCPEGMFPDARKQFLYLLEKDVTFNASQREAIASFISQVPEGNTALHGDMHIGNLISTLQYGEPMSAAHDVFFIDLGCFATGYHLFDLGMTQMICLYSDDAFFEHDYHITRGLAVKFWESFVKYYFEGKYDVETATRMIDPYCCCKCLLVEFNLGFMPEGYKKLIERTFGFR